MTQAYGSTFAKIYNLRWNQFAQHAAPLILQYYESIPGWNQQRTMLDLCCGTGQLARHFLENGYTITGIDLSTDMLHWARENNLPFLAANQALFIQADASNFSVESKTGLVVSTFDALNHLPGFPALETCFDCVRASLVEGGIFIFDLNTSKGLKDGWNSIQVEDKTDFLLLNRSLWIEEDQRAFTRITGFIQQENELYQRFEETVYNCAFALDEVSKALQVHGFKSVTISRLNELGKPLAIPENEGRVFFIATC
jgi:SAM-dependent methyltransferase